MAGENRIFSLFIPRASIHEEIEINKKYISVHGRQYQICKIRSGKGEWKNPQAYRVRCVPDCKFSTKDVRF